MQRRRAKHELMMRLRGLTLVLECLSDQLQTLKIVILKTTLSRVPSQLTEHFSCECFKPSNSSLGREIMMKGETRVAVVSISSHQWSSVQERSDL